MGVNNLNLGYDELVLMKMNYPFFTVFYLFMIKKIANPEGD